MSIINPQPCPPSGGGSGVDVEDVLLCDFDEDGNVVGSTLAVYEYDSNGVPTGPPTFVDPATGDPYVVVGTLRPCAGGGGVAETVDVSDRAGRLLGHVTVDGTVSVAEPVTVEGTVAVTGTVGISGEVEVKNDAGNPIPISAVALPLPVGATTEVTSLAVLAALVAIAAAVDGLEINTTDLATQTTLAAVLSALGTIDTHVDGLEANTTGLATQATLASVLVDTSAIDDKLPDESGTWDYRAGTSGSVAVPAGGRVIGITATGDGGTVEINGGDLIPVIFASVVVTPRANLIAPTIDFVGTTAYLVEFVT